MFQEIKPSKGIDNVIDTFWTYSKNRNSEVFKVLPDTCTDLIFDLNQNKGFLSGVMTNYQQIELTPETHLIGVRFEIEKFSVLTKVPLNETKNLRVELSEIFQLKKLNSLKRLNDHERTADKINFLEKFISRSLGQDSEKKDEIVLSITQRIRETKGIVNAVDLAKSHYISLRQLERRFKSFTGLTIKEFSSVVRFKNAKRLIATFPKTSLLEIAFDAGFFDHSHMTYEFKRISGESPSFFR